VERVKDRGRVFKPVIDGVFVAVERVQRGDLHAAPELFAAFVEPVAVDLPGPSGHQIEQPCSRACGFPSSSGVRSTIPVSSLGPRPAPGPF
jgi:hypothetical protein